jgi:lipopolysaccharide transport system permease protein
MLIKDRPTPWLLIYAYRARIIEAILHELNLKYVGSAFGAFWAVLYPLLQLGIYATLYAFVFRIRPAGLDEFAYVLLVFSGLVPLLAFNEAMVASMNSLVANKALLLNTVFPAELIPLRAALAAQVPGLVGLIITLVLGFVLGRTNWLALILIPALWCLLVMFAAGIGWALSLLTLISKDVLHGIGLVTMLLFVLSPFAYTPDMVPSALRMFLWLNPLSYFVLSFQQVLCYGSLPAPAPAIGALVLGIGFFLAGFMLFQRGKRVFFDYA